MKNCIFLPLLFHHPRPELQTKVSSTIPKPPAMQNIQLQLTEAVQPQKTVQVAKSANPVQLAAETPSVSANLLKTPQAWTLQVATFQNKKNAEHLLKKLRSKGFDVYIRASMVNHKTFTKVYVGPQIDQGRLKDLQRKLKKQYRLNGLIAKYSA